MIIDNFNIVDVPVAPSKTDTPLPVDANAVLTFTVPVQSFKMIARRNPQGLQICDRLKHIHINDNYRLWDDDMIVGSVHTLEFLEFIYWLRHTGYEGYMTLDQFPYREDGREAIDESAKWLDYLESIVDRADMDEVHATLAKNDAIASSRLMRRLLGGK